MNPIEKTKNLDWSTRRKYMYFGGFILIFLVILGYFIYPIIFPVPTCYDKKQNGTETGVDCGGACNLMCKGQYDQLDLLLQRSFVKKENQSDIVVLFENRNKYIAPNKISLDIDVYAKDGSFVKTIHEEQIAGTQKYIPIVIANYPSSDISKIFVKNVSYDMWRTRGAYDIALSDYNFAKDKMSLDVTLKNIYKQDLREKLKVYVVVRDNLNNIIAVNYQILDGINYNESKKINFLWPNPIEGDIKNIDVFVTSNLYY